MDKRRVVEAIYHNGVLQLAEVLDLPDNQRVVVTVEVADPAEAGRSLSAWEAVLSGLSDEDIADVERSVLDRHGFMATAEA